MYKWRRGIFAAAALLAGCTGTIGGTGTGGPGGAIDVDGDGIPDGIDSDGDGDIDGIDTDGDGDIDTPIDGNPNVCVPGIPQTSQLPRLTKAQYDNTVRDLLAIEGQPSSLLAPDSTGSVDKRAWDGYQAAAESVSAQVLSNATARARAIPCTDGSDACARQFIETFGRRAFRRPLTAEEITRFETLYTTRAEITQTGTFDEAAQLIVKAFLLSPTFLMRSETTDVRDGSKIPLSGFEVASRLSYMLWDSMPDDTLLDAAQANALASPEQILSQAQRMLADPKARAKVTEFHRHYAHMGPGTRWAEISRDSQLFPAFNSSLVPLLSEETERFFDHVVFDGGGGFQDLMTSQVAFVNSDLAPMYGLSAASYGAELEPVTLEGNGRPGVFTRLGFLTSHSLFNRTSPILRGAFIQKQVLCREIGAPPADAESTPLPTSADLKTNRQRVDAQTAGGACANCHIGLINPTGFPLETFDAIGAIQTMDNGVPIDTTANVLIGATSVPVAGPADLFNAIADSPEGQRCYAKHWVQFAYERTITNEDSCTVDTLATKLTQDGYTVLNLIADLTQSESFRYRAVPSEVAP